MNKNLFLLLPIALTLSGCGSLMTRSAEELREAQDSATRVCTALSLDDAAERVRAGWRGCHFTGPTPSTNQAVMAGKVPILVPTGDYAGDFIRVEKQGNRLTVVKGANSSKLGIIVQLMADIEETAACKAQVTARGSGPVWNNTAKAVSYYLENPDKGCEP